MTPTEIGQLLALVVMGDMRKVDKTVIKYWQAILPHWLTLDDARLALIEHRRTSTEYLQPAHLIKIAEPRYREAQRRQTDLQESNRILGSIAGAGEERLTFEQVRDRLPKESQAFLAKLYAKDQARQRKRKRPPKQLGES